jgi:phosphoribosylpyrophosphate synthetase
MATHAIFSSAAADALATPMIDSIVITDIVSPERTALGAARAKRSVVSIAPLVANAIDTLHHERSMAQIIDAARPVP